MRVSTYFSDPASLAADADAAERAGSRSKGVIAAWRQHVRMMECAASMLAATRSRCGCGNHGDWSCDVSGTSGDRPCVWAGCANCRGTAVGVPVSQADRIAWSALTPYHRAVYIAAVSSGVIGRKEIEIELDTTDSTFDFEAR